jgi:hypothetical protein
MVELAVIEIPAEAEVAVRGRQEVVFHPDGESVNGGDCRLGGGFDRCSGGVIGLGGHFYRGAAQVSDAGHGLDGLLDMEAAHCAATAGSQVVTRGIKDGRNAVHSARGALQPIGHRRELAAQEPEQAASEQVAVDNRTPGKLVELLVLEPHLVDRGEQHAPIDLLVSGEALGRFQTSACIGQPGEALVGTRIGEVGPEVVVFVVPGLSRVDRVEAEEIGEEGVLRLGESHSRMVTERAHGSPTSGAARSVTTPGSELPTSGSVAEADRFEDRIGQEPVHGQVGFGTPPHMDHQDLTVDVDDIDDVRVAKSQAALAPDVKVLVALTFEPNRDDLGMPPAD